VAISGTNVVYTPALNFNGAGSFSYTISDGTGGSASATVSVTVTAVNDAPVAVNDAAATAAGTAVTINVVANDTDVDGPLPLVVGSVTQPAAGGTVAIVGGSVRFTPAAGFSGVTSFTYRSADGLGALSQPATVTVTVNAGAAVDLDIAAFNATGRVRNGALVALSMNVRNPGTVNQARTATVVGRRLASGVEVYRQSQLVSDAPRGGTTTATFPAYRTVAADIGTLTWTATITDDNPDIDQATAATTVR
jgi:hypothetical protein